MRFLLVSITVFLASCSYDPTYTSYHSSSSLVVALQSTLPLTKNRATTWSAYQCKITQSNGEVWIDTTIESSQSLVQVAFENLPEDTGYSLEVWTTNENNQIIHAPRDTTFTILTDSTTMLALTLTPRVGSLQLQLSDISTALDSVSFVFESDSGLFTYTKKRSSLVFISLDNIPYHAFGVVKVYGVTLPADTVISWEDTLTFMGGQSVEMRLNRSGTLSVNISVVTPPSSVIAGRGGTTQLASEVNRGVMITEFCATAGSGSSSRDFVEIMNITTEEITLDSLSLYIGDGAKKLGTITLQGGEHLTIGTSFAQEVWAIDSLRTLDITSTSAQLYLYDGATLLDYLFYANDTSMGWEKLSSSAKTSWEFVGLDSSCFENNYSENWRRSTTLFATFESSNWYGTPGE